MRPIKNKYFILLNILIILLGCQQNRIHKDENQKINLSIMLLTADMHEPADQTGDPTLCEL